MKRLRLRAAMTGTTAALLLIVLASGSVTASAQRADSPIDAKIEVVWPHDASGNPVAATHRGDMLVNVLVYLFQRGTLDPIACSTNPPVQLVWALNVMDIKGGGGLLPAKNWTITPSQFVQEPPQAQKLMLTRDGKTFPAWVFNNIYAPTFPPEAVSAPELRYYFMVQIPGIDTRTNVWAHAADGRTFSPSAVGPSGKPVDSPQVDTFIDTVWPHDRLGHPTSVLTAPLANVRIHVMPDQYLGDPAHESVPLDSNIQIQLERSVNDGYLEPIAQAEKVPITGGSPGQRLTYPNWIVNDVSVSAANDPHNIIFFAAYATNRTTYPTVWAHAADAITNFPHPDIPTSSCHG